jgi:hypothetical protein
MRRSSVSTIFRFNNQAMIAAIRTTELKDLSALSKFLVSVYQFAPGDHHADTKLLQWKYLRSNGEGSRSYLLERDGQIIAHCGVCPVTFHLPDGTTVNSVTMMDWAADPAAPGAGVKLFRKLMEMAPTSFVIGGAPVTRLIVPRIGFRPAGEVLTYAAWLRPWHEFRTRFRSRRSTLRLLHGLAHPARNRKRASAEWDFVPIDQFHESLLPDGTKRPWTFCERTVADLNHLMKCPHLEMRAFLLRRRGEIVGYFVLGRAQWEACLIDLVVNSPDENDWNLACAIVTQAARRYPEVCRIRAQASFPVMRQALSWNGYWRQFKEPMMIHDPTNALDHAFPISFQLLDGDSGY